MKSKSAANADPSGDALTMRDASVDGRGALETGLARLRHMLEQGKVDEARAWMKELECQWPDSDAVRSYARVLAPPRVSVRSGHRGQSRQRERAWLREHAREYPGQWLAVLADQLIAADPDLDNILTAVRETPGAQRALLHFQPGAPA